MSCKEYYLGQPVNTVNGTAPDGAGNVALPVADSSTATTDNTKKLVTSEFGKKAYMPYLGTITAADLDTIKGNCTFSGANGTSGNLEFDGSDWNGWQIGDTQQRQQFICKDTNGFYWRVNDAVDTNTTSWTNWMKLTTSDEALYISKLVTPLGIATSADYAKDFFNNSPIDNLSVVDASGVEKCWGYILNYPWRNYQNGSQFLIGNGEFQGIKYRGIGGGTFSPWVSMLGTDAYSMSGNGYFKEKTTSLTIQWGTSSSTTRDTWITFPKAFTAVYSVVGIAKTSSNLTGSQSNFGVKNIGTTGFTGNMYDNGNGYAGFNWIAIGVSK